MNKQCHFAIVRDLHFWANQNKNRQFKNMLLSLASSMCSHAFNAGIIVCFCSSCSPVCSISSSSSSSSSLSCRYPSTFLNRRERKNQTSKIIPASVVDLCAYVCTHNIERNSNIDLNKCAHFYYFVYTRERVCFYASLIWLYCYLLRPFVCCTFYILSLSYVCVRDRATFINEHDETII